MMNRRRVGARAEPARVAVRRDGDVRKRAARTTRGDARVGNRRARASQYRVLGACVEMCLVLGVFLGIGSLAAALSNPTVRLTARKRASDTRLSEPLQRATRRRKKHFHPARSCFGTMSRHRARRAAPVAASRAAAVAALLASCVLAAAAAAGDGARATHSRSESRGVTSAFQRPPAHPALDLADARVRPARPRGRALRASDSFDAPEQVHLLPGGPNEMVVVWASASVADVDAVVRYASEESLSRRRSFRTAAVHTTAYTAQLCLGESMSVDPAMGDRHPVDLEALVALANTSAWAPRDANNLSLIHI